MDSLKTNPTKHTTKPCLVYTQNNSTPPQNITQSDSTLERFRYLISGMDDARITRLHREMMRSLNQKK